MAADATGIREYKGAAVQSVLVAGVNATSPSFSITPTTNWPTGAVGQFTITIDQGISAEECILCSAQTSGVITVVTRGYDGTAAVPHSAGAIVTHGPSAVDVAEANYIANTHAQTSKVTPVDADEIGLFDSAATFGLKKLTIANLKALVAAYLASLTQAFTNKDLTAVTNTFPASLATLTGTQTITGKTMAYGSNTFTGFPSPAPWTSSAISTNTTLVSRTQYFVTTSSAWTLTLPASPVQGDEIRIFDASGSAATNNITVAPNGLNFQGSVQTLVLAYAYVSVTLIYTGATYGWKVA